MTLYVRHVIKLLLTEYREIYMPAFGLWAEGGITSSANWVCCTGQRYRAGIYRDTCTWHITQAGSIVTSQRMKLRKYHYTFQRSIYGLYIKLAPFFGDLKNFPETKNNSRFYILKLYFLLHYNQFSCSVTSLLNIALQSWCILFKIRKIDVFLAK